MNSDPCPTELDRPRLILRVGGLGNRTFGREAGIAESPEPIVEAVSQRCTEVWTAIESALAELHQLDQAMRFGPPPPRHASGEWKRLLSEIFFESADRWGWQRRLNRPASVFSPERPKVQVLTGEADGADQLIRDSALGRHRSDVPVDYEHLAILPAAPDAVPTGLGVGRPPEKQAPLEAARSGRIPLDRDASARLARIIRHRAYAFRAQSEALRHHSDLLVVVWDPDTVGRAGGTEESVSEALAERIPVILIRVGHGTAVSLLRDLDDLRRLESASQHATSPESTWKAVRELVFQLVGFPDGTKSAGEHPEAGHDVPPSEFAPRIAFAEFREARQHRAPWTSRVWNVAKWLEELGRPPGRVPAVEDPPQYLIHYGRARWHAASGGLSGAFGNAHRGGILASHLMGALAVLLAATASILHTAHALLWIQVLVALIEVAVIGSMFAVSHVSQSEDWNVAYTDTRILAEALRIMRFLGPLGVHTPLPRLQTPLDAPREHPSDSLWALWYFRALVRMAPLRIPAATPPGDLEALRTLVIREAVESQQAYHRANRKRQHRRHLGIERCILGAFALVAIFAVAHLADLLLGWHSQAIAQASLLACVVGPAVIASLHGLASQLEVQRLKHRSDNMESLLEQRLRTLRSLDLTSDPQGAPASWGLSAEALATASLLMEETAGWSLLYRNSDIPLV